MVESIDELAPGAKNDFARRIFGDGPEISYEGLDENELAEHMNKLGKAWKNLCSRQLAKV